MTFETDRMRRMGRPSPRSAANFPWGWGALGLTVLLGMQIVWFEGNRLVQNPHVRPFLDSFCGTLRCTLPPFKDLTRIRIEDRGLSTAPDGREGFDFRLIFSNQSDLPQVFPDLKLTLNQLDGSPVAERVFSPSEYFPEWREGMMMPMGRPFEIHLSMAKPSGEVGGFIVEFQ